MKKIGCVVLVLVVIISVVLFSISSNDNSSKNSDDNNISIVISDTKATTESNKKIYEDNNISVDFVSFSDNVLDGMFDLCINVSNESEENITVYIKDFRINNSTVEVGSGVPCDIVSGANRTHNFFGRLDLAGLNSAGDATELIFKIWVVNESTETLITTEDLTITL